MWVWGDGSVNKVCAMHISTWVQIPRIYVNQTLYPSAPVVRRETEKSLPGVLAPASLVSTVVNSWRFYLKWGGKWGLTPKIVLWTTHMHTHSQMNIHTLNTHQIWEELEYFTNKFVTCLALPFFKLIKHQTHYRTYEQSNWQKRCCTCSPTIVSQKLWLILVTILLFTFIKFSLFCYPAILN